MSEKKSDEKELAKKFPLHNAIVAGIMELLSISTESLYEASLQYRKIRILEACRNRACGARKYYEELDDDNVTINAGDNEEVRCVKNCSNRNRVLIELFNKESITCYTFVHKCKFTDSIINKIKSTTYKPISEPVSQWVATCFIGIADRPGKKEFLINLGIDQCISRLINNISDKINDETAKECFIQTINKKRVVVSNAEEVLEAIKCVFYTIIMWAWNYSQDF